MIYNLEDFSIIMFMKYLDMLFNTKILCRSFEKSQIITVLDENIIRLTKFIESNMWKLNYVPSPVPSDISSLVCDVCRQYNHFPDELDTDTARYMLRSRPNY